MAIVYLALGSNVGKRHVYIKRAVDALNAVGILVKRVSTIIETNPVGGPAQGKYLNAVLKAETRFSPEDLFQMILSIEHKLGRVRNVINGPRVIDIDILLYGDIKLINRRLIIPHPRMLERDFVMDPLEEIAPVLCASLRI